MAGDILKKVNGILDLMQEGDAVINYTNNTNVILILGNTGAGKTTLTHFMAGNNDCLISKEVNDGSGEYLIEDLNDKIGKSISSKTRFPELMIDPETNTAFYDMPGFSDTRSSEQEISAAYCTKKVIDRYSNIKILFVINYSSVRIGVDRRDFMLLVDHATSLIKDVTKFQNSVALVVSKVDNTVVKNGKIYELVSDEKIVETVLNFLRTVKLDCEKYVKKNSTKDIYLKAIKFIDLFLSKNETNSENTLNNVSNYISEQLKTHELLIKIYHRLSKYDIQVSVNGYIAETCYKDLKLKNKPPLQSIENLTGIDLSEISLDTSQNIILCNILNLTMNNKIDVQYVSNKLIVRAAYLKFSDLPDIENYIKIIELNALNKVFIDEDITSFGNNVQIFLFAPQWEVIGERLINLDGANGQYLPPAEDGMSWWNPNGKDGMPGLPGKRGGNFYGIVGTVINGDHLTISANGGNGGNGQNGGKGRDGKIGRSPPNPNKNSNIESYSEFTIIKQDDDLIVPTLVYNYVRRCAYYNVRGHSGSEGGNGGHGGIGGFGGKKGNITVIALDKSEVKIKLNEGETGERGKGGTGGTGGLDGDIINIRLGTSDHWILFIPIKENSLNSIISRKSGDHYSYGSPGITGYNEFPKNFPEPPLELILSNQTDNFINYYNTFNHGSVIQSEYEQFLNKLKSHPKTGRLFQLDPDNKAVESHRKRRSLEVNHLFSVVAKNGATSQSKSLINYSLNWVVTGLIAFNPMTVLTNWCNCIGNSHDLQKNTMFNIHTDSTLNTFVNLPNINTHFTNRSNYSEKNGSKKQVQNIII